MCPGTFPTALVYRLRRSGALNVALRTQVYGGAQNVRIAATMARTKARKPFLGCSDAAAQRAEVRHEKKTAQKKIAVQAKKREGKQTRPKRWLDHCQGRRCLRT